VTRTVTRLFDNYADAEAAVTALEAEGVPHSDITIVGSNVEGLHDHHMPHTGDPGAAGRDAGKGASVGGLVGGGAGLLAGLGIMAVPGLGPVVAAGWLVSALVGAAAGAAVGGAAGGLVGALTHAGVPEPDAHVYAEGVRRGGTLVSAKVGDNKFTQTEALLARFKATDAATRGAAYRASGWSAHDPSAPFYTPEQIAAERKTFTPIS
jgi:hypothetical protein